MKLTPFKVILYSKYRIFIHLIIIATILIPITTTAQNDPIWPKAYFKDVDVAYESVCEAYDGGYLISGWYGGSYPSYGWLIKTDINGEPIWQKDFGDKGKVLTIQDHESDFDGNIFVIANSNMIDDYFDPVIMKLSPCGELIWSKLLHTPLRYDKANNIKVLNDGNIIVSIPYHKDSFENRVCMMLFDSNGEIIWENYYMKSIAITVNEEVYDICQLPNGNIVFCGQCDYYPEEVGYGHLKAFFSCIDLDGNIIWEKVLDQDILDEDGSYHIAYSVTPSLDGNSIYAGLYDSYQTHEKEVRPSLLNLDMEGNQISKVSIPDDHDYGDIRHLEQINETNFISSITCGDASTPREHKIGLDYLVAYDRNEGSESSKALRINYAYLFNAEGEVINHHLVNLGFIPLLEKTQDNHYLFYYNSSLEIEEHPSAYLTKFDSNLELAAFDDTPYNYDYLCDSPIKHDTISLKNCVVVGLDEEKSQMRSSLIKTFPNPCTNNLRIQLPDFIHLEKGRVRQHLYHYQAKTRLEVLNINGHIIYTTGLQQGEKEITLNTITWPQGIYMVRLVNGDKVVAREKVIKE